MKTAINKSLLIWIVTILVVTNASTIATILYRNSQIQKAIENPQPEIEIPDGHLGRFFRNELGLNPQQHRQFRVFRQKFHSQANSLSAQMQLTRNEMLEELGKEESDTVRLHHLAEELGQMHTELKHLTFEYYLSMKSICNPEQQQKLYGFFKTTINKQDEQILPMDRK